MSETRKLSLRGGFDASRLQSWTSGNSCSGKRIPFKGIESIPYPQIGSIYLCHVEDFGNKFEESKRRPMILIAYYTHQGKVVAADFICPTTQASGRCENADRYEFEMPYSGCAKFTKASPIVNCSSIITLPNNPDSIIKGPIGKSVANVLPDYFLRKCLVAYEAKPRWKKDADIPEGAVRHGVVLDGLDTSMFKFKDRLSPDFKHKDHQFVQVDEGPRFLLDAMPTIMNWASRAHEILIYSKQPIDLPKIRTFSNWPQPTDLITSFRPFMEQKLG